MKRKQKFFALTTLLALFTLASSPAWSDRDHDDDDRDRNGWSWGRDDRDAHDWDRHSSRWDDDDERDWNRSWSSWSKEWNDWNDRGWSHGGHNGKIYICHRTSSSRNPYVLLKVSISAKQAHYDHGDPVNFVDRGYGRCAPSAPVPSKPEVTLSLAASEILVNTATTATWTSTNATSCKLNGSTPVAVNGSAPVGPYSSPGNRTITVTCMGAGGSDSDSETLRVKAAPPAPPSVTLTLEPSQIDIGAKARLSWSSTNATSCRLQGSGSLYANPFNIQIAESGYYMKGPFSKAGTATYTVTCSGQGGTDSETVTLTVVGATPAPSVTLSVAPATVNVGVPATLSWDSTNAASCTLGSGTLGADGSTTVSYAVPGTYTLTIECTGAGGTATASVQLSVTALPPVSLTACSRLDATDLSTLYTWSVSYFPSTGEFSGPGSGGIGAISGTITPAGDVLVAGKTIQYSVDELNAQSIGTASVAPPAPGLDGVLFRATFIGGGGRADIAFVSPGSTCAVPAPR